MPEKFDDSDMKIVGAPQKKADDVDFQGFLAESSRQHFNGNIAKAKTLGANIVSSFSYSAAPVELVELIRQSGVEPTDEVLRQARFLSVFSAEISLEGRGIRTGTILIRMDGRDDHPTEVTVSLRDEAAEAGRRAEQSARSWKKTCTLLAIVFAVLLLAVSFAYVVGGTGHVALYAAF